MNQQQEDWARHEMWKRLGCKSKHERIAHAADRCLKPHQLTPTPQDVLRAMNNYDKVSPINLAPLIIPTVMKASVDYAYAQVQTQTLSNAPIKKGNKMYDDFDDCECMNAPAKTDETKKREYLARRVSSTEDVLRSKLMKQFYMYAETPNTLKELVERIQAGTFTLDKKAERSYVASIYNIDWHDPAHPADQAGYDLATAALEKEHTKVMDLAKIGDIDEALKAVYAFESWTYTA